MNYLFLILLTMKTTRHLLSIFCLAIILVPAYAQEKTKQLSDSLTIHYTLNDQQKLDGLYSLKDKSGETLLRGLYKNGERVGNWFAFNKDKSTFLRYNYASKQILELDADQMQKAKIRVQGGSKQSTQDARIPFPVFPLEIYIDLIQEKAKNEIPSYQRNPQAPILAEITAEIDATGETRYSLKYILENKTFNTQFKFEEPYLDFSWVPAQYQDQALPSTFTVFAEILYPDAPDHKRVIWK